MSVCVFLRYRREHERWPTAVGDTMITSRPPVIDNERFSFKIQVAITVAPDSQREILMGWLL